MDQILADSAPSEALIGMLLAQLDGPVSLPARPWPLADGCRVLAARLPYSATAASTARQAVAQPCSDSLLERWVHALAQKSVLRPLGRGLTARWDVSETWRLQWQVLVGLLDDSERAVWVDAAHALQRSLSTAAKIAAAASSEASASAT